MTLGKQFKRARLKLGFKLPQAAEKIGISKGALSNLENGVNTNPGVETLTKIAKCYGIKFVIT